MNTLYILCIERGEIQGKDSSAEPTLVMKLEQHVAREMLHQYVSREMVNANFIFGWCKTGWGFSRTHQENT